jgi:hypothetical protein
MHNREGPKRTTRPPHRVSSLWLSQTLERLRLPTTTSTTEWTSGATNTAVFVLDVLPAVTVVHLRLPTCKVIHLIPTPLGREASHSCATPVQRDAVYDTNVVAPSPRHHEYAGQLEGQGAKG